MEKKRERVCERESERERDSVCLWLCGCVQLSEGVRERRRQ